MRLSAIVVATIALGDFGSGILHGLNCRRHLNDSGISPKPV
jgi:hypothetical protein